MPLTPPNNLLYNSYIKNSIIRLNFLYVLNINTNIHHVHQLLFIIRSTNSFFIHYFELQKLEFKLLIDNMPIDILS